MIRRTVRTLGRFSGNTLRTLCTSGTGRSERGIPVLASRGRARDLLRAHTRSASTRKERAMQKRTLGPDGPEVSAIGLGCMGMSAFYGATDERSEERRVG